MKTATNLVTTQDAIKLFEPDMLAPDQFYATLKRKPLRRPGAQADGRLTRGRRLVLGERSAALFAPPT